MVAHIALSNDNKTAIHPSMNVQLYLYDNLFAHSFSVRNTINAIAMVIAIKKKWK